MFLIVPFASRTCTKCYTEGAKRVMKGVARGMRGRLVASLKCAAHSGGAKLANNDQKKATFGLGLRDLGMLAARRIRRIRQLE